MQPASAPLRCQHDHPLPSEGKACICKAQEYVTYRRGLRGTGTEQRAYRRTLHRSGTGDGWACGFHPSRWIAVVSGRVEVAGGVLYEGDCLAVMPALPSSSVDLILCDLPYGTTQNRWDSVIDLPGLWSEYRRLLKPSGAIVLTSQGAFTARLILSNEDWFRYKLVWEKSKATNFLNAKKQPLRKHEDVCVFYPGKPTYNPQMGEGAAYDKGVRKDQQTGSYGDFSASHVRSEGGRYPTDVVYFKTAESEPERTVWHSTQKPVGLGQYLIRTYSNPGDLVLDNAFGSGSFLVAAQREQRRFIGIEKNEYTELFKGERVDCMAVAASRLGTGERIAA